jgi:hypothetical protein
MLSPAPPAPSRSRVGSKIEKSLPDAVQDSLALMEASLRTDDFKEAMAAMGEKRRPRFADPE